MVKVNLPSDFANEVAKALGLSLKAVEDICDFSEDKDGYFYARLKPKKYFEKPDFQAMCALVRDLGGENYLEGMKAWRVPGPYAKKSPTTSKEVSGIPEKPPEVGVGSKKEPSGVTPHILSDDKSKLEFPNIKFIPIDAIEAPSFLPTRELISHEKLAEIRNSIKKHGLKYAIKVRPGSEPGTYELKDGFLRLKSVQQLGWKEIPAEIKETSDPEVVVESLITDKHRIEEDPITVAKKLDILVNAFGYTQEKLAEELGTTQSWISHTISILKLPKEIQHYVALHNVSYYHALLLLTLEDQQLQSKLAKEIVDEDLSTRQLEERIREFKPQPPATPKPESAGKTGSPSIGTFQARVTGEDSASVPCANCGDPVTEPIPLDGKFYCHDCAEQVQAEKEPSVLSESKSGPFEKEPAETSEEIGEHEKVSKKERLEAVQIGEFDCTECGKHFLVEHLHGGEHRLRLVREEED